MGYAQVKKNKCMYIYTQVFTLIKPTFLNKNGIFFSIDFLVRKTVNRFHLLSSQKIIMKDCQ